MYRNVDFSLVICLLQLGGLFSFAIRFPPEYPNSPPLVRHLTTDGGKVRFNPNWYKDGKVCVSILG